MNALSVAFKDLQILFKDRGAMLQMFLIPLAFIFAISMAVPPIDTAEKPATLPVVNLDPGGEASQALIDGLNADGKVQVELHRQAEAQALLEARTIYNLLTIPAGFSQDTAAGNPVTLRLLNHPNADPTNTALLLRVINGVAQRTSLQAELIASLSQMGDMQPAGSAEAQAFSPENSVAQAKSQFERSKTSPLVVLEKTEPQALGEAIKNPSWVQQNIPGYTLIMVFGIAVVTAMSIYNEKKVGSFHRLLASPISKAALLAGKMLPNFIMALILIAVLFAVSILVLPILGVERVTLGHDILAFVVVSLMVALCSTSFGVFIAAITRTEGQINALGSIGIWLLGFLGGCLLPPFVLEFLGLGAISRAVPHYWAITAYQDLMVRGRGLADITTPLLALLAFSAIFFAIGVWRFKFD
jgi:linearmycin/streptolysin S transport system permease protein